jgi:hypothetical protein
VVAAGADAGGLVVPTLNASMLEFALLASGTLDSLNKVSIKSFLSPSSLNNE